MPLPEFPISETKINGFINLMDMQTSATFFDLYKRSNKQGKAVASASLSEDKIYQEILTEYQKNLKLLLKTIDENPNGFFIYSIVNMFEFYAKNILPIYSLEERLKLYPEFGILLGMALAINFEQQKLLVYKLSENEEAIEYWKFLKTKAAVSGKVVLSRDINYQEMFSININEIIRDAEIIFLMMLQVIKYYRN